MIRILNTTTGAIGLTLDPTHMVPAGGHLDIEEETLLNIGQNNVPLQAYFTNGALVFKGVDETVTVDITPDDKKDATANVPERTEVIREAISRVHQSDFSGDGRPKVEAINALLAEGVEKTNAAERDAVWDMMGGKV